MTEALVFFLILLMLGGAFISPSILGYNPSMSMTYRVYDMLSRTCIWVPAGMLITSLFIL